MEFFVRVFRADTLKRVWWPVGLSGLVFEQDVDVELSLNFLLQRNTKMHCIPREVVRARHCANCGCVRTRDF